VIFLHNTNKIILVQMKKHTIALIKIILKFILTTIIIIKLVIYFILYITKKYKYNIAIFMVFNIDVKMPYTSLLHKINYAI